MPSGRRLSGPKMLPAVLDEATPCPVAACSGRTAGVRTRRVAPGCSRRRRQAWLGTSWLLIDLYDDVTEVAVRNGTALPVDQIQRVATTVEDVNLAVRLLQVAAPDASDVVVLNELGGVCRNLTTWEKGDFEFRPIRRTVTCSRFCRTRACAGPG